MRTAPWFVALLLAARCLASPTTAPTNAPPPPRTGEITLTFTERSPLSTPKEIARRIRSQVSDLPQGDYDLATFPFRTYIPRNYDSSVPCGIFVYLGNHDVHSVATRWEPLFDKSHMIFIAPDWHSPMPEWQLIGLGFDAVDNLKRLYNIDTHRLYDMWFNSGSLRMSFAGTDVYTGMIVGEDWEYFRKINMPGNRFHDADFLPPPHELLERAKSQGIVLIGLTPPDIGQSIIATALKQDGFDNVLTISLTYQQLHYPNYDPSWIADPVLPFLDKAAKQSQHQPPTAATPVPLNSAPATTTNRALSTPPPARPASATSDAQHLLTMAQLYISNGATELARTKLQTILTRYPQDPAAATAKKLLDSLPPPPAQQ